MPGEEFGIVFLQTVVTHCQIYAVELVKMDPHGSDVGSLCCHLPVSHLLFMESKGYYFSQSTDECKVCFSQLHLPHALKTKLRTSDSG